MYFLGGFKIIRNTKWWQHWHYLAQTVDITSPEYKKKREERALRIMTINGIIAIIFSTISVLIWLLRQ